MIEKVYRKKIRSGESEEIKVSLVMVVKDEEETLESVILAARPVVSEIVIGVDSTCNEETREIADRYADTFFEFKWENNFAKARNDAIDLANGQWIFILDGHEFLDPDSIPVVNGITRKVFGTNVDIIFGKLLIEPDEHGIPKTILSQPRVFKNKPEYRYRYAVHNDLEGYNSRNSIIANDLRIIHQMPDSRKEWRQQQRADMNEKGLRKLLEENPDDERSIYYLAQTLVDDGRGDEALPLFEKHVQIAKQVGYKWQSLYQIAIGRFNQGDLDTAYDTLHDCMKVQFNRAEQYMLLAVISKHRELLEEAKHWARTAASMEYPKKDVLFIRPAHYSWSPWLMIAQCCEEQQKYGDAIDAAQRCLEYVPELKEANDILLRCQKRHEVTVKKGGKNIVIFDEIGSFTQPLMDHWRSIGHKVSILPQFVTKAMQGADLVFIEWGMQNSARASQRQWKCPVYVRCHRTEVYTGYAKQTQWKNVNGVIFTSEHIKRSASAMGVSIQCPQHVIHSAINTGSFDFDSDRPRGHDLAMVGYLNYKKGIPLILQAMHELVMNFGTDWKLHFAGDFQQPEVEEYLFEMLKELDLKGNIVLHGWMNDVNEFLQDKDYIVNASLTEGLPYSVSEGMACGLKPLIHRWPGASELYPERYLWTTPSEFCEKLVGGEFDRREYRNFVLDNYDIKEEHTAIDEIVGVQQTEPDLEEVLEVAEPSSDAMGVLESEVRIVGVQ